LLSKSGGAQRRSDRLTRRQAWAALAALIVVSTALRAWAALEVPAPWIAPDEMVYGLLGRSLYFNGSLSVLGGSTPFYSFLTPLLVGFPLSSFGLATGYDVLHGLQALVMSLAAVPAYLWARSLVPRRAALVAAALTLATPALTYSGLLMTEVLFYPLLAVAAWAGAEAIVRPSRQTAALLVVAVAAASATRLQAIVLLPALATAAFVDAALARSWANLRRLVPAAVGLAVLVVTWVGWRLGSGSGTLGGYEVVAGSPYSAGDAAKYVVYHLAGLLILCGLFPTAAVAVMLVHGLRRGERNLRVRAYLAVASSLSAWLVVEVGVFASRYSHRIVERNMIALAPVLFVGLVLWLDRGLIGDQVERAAVAVTMAAVLLVLPVKQLVAADTVHDAMTLIPLYKLLQASSSLTLVAVYASAAALAAAGFALLPRCALQAVPAVLLVALVAASVVASRYVADQARAQESAFGGGDPRWIDHSAHGSVAYLYDAPAWNSVWETLFWNDRVNRVYDLGAANVPGPLPQSPAEVQPDGTLFLPPSAPRPGPYAVASTGMTLLGDKVKSVKEQGLPQEGLILWRLDQPLRLLTWTSGLQPNGDIGAAVTARLRAYSCTGGTFRLTMIVKQPQTVEIRVNGRLSRRMTFRVPIPSWHGDFAVRGRGGECTLEVTPTGLLGTTMFKFDRG
jgi:hypothetical protein